MTRTTRAVVQTGTRALEMRELPLPEIGADDALLRVEACGICGSDYEQFAGALPVRFPVIPGHEPVGRIAEVGANAAKKWGVREGDRVCVEALVPCGECEACGRGEHRLCTGRRGTINSYGFLPLEIEPGLWGGYSEYLYLSPHALVHRIDEKIAPEIATLFNPIGAGFRWAVEMPRLQAGESIVVLGPGQRGLASVIAAKEAGAGKIIVTGLGRDADKLTLAREFGADVTIDVEKEDLRTAVREATGRGADVVIDVTAYSTEAVTQAFDLARRGGRVVLAGTKGARPVADFYSDRVVIKELTIYGALGVDSPAYERAIRLIESGKYPLEKMHTHTLPLTDAERALRLLAGEEPGESAIHIALVP